MNDHELREALRQSLQDRQLTRGERRALRELLQDRKVTSKQRELLRHEAFELVRGELLDPQSKQLLEWLEDVVRAVQAPNSDRDEDRAEACFTPGDNCPRRIAALLGRCRRSIDICVFTITDDRVSREITAAHQRGVSVRVVSDNEKAYDRGSDILRLHGQGVPVRVDDSPYHMHHKFALFDGGTLATGSYNWTRGAAECNSENLVLLEDRRLIGEFSREFEKIWKNSSPLRPN
jgi:phosphatidylserine/phosphatidylglycerophosphate/cardiolipin synthase-like enzyme